VKTTSIWQESVLLQNHIWYTGVLLHFRIRDKDRFLRQVLPLVITLGVGGAALSGCLETTDPMSAQNVARVKAEFQDVDKNRVTVDAGAGPGKLIHLVDPNVGVDSRMYDDLVVFINQQGKAVDPRGKPELESGQIADVPVIEKKHKN